MPIAMAATLLVAAASCQKTKRGEYVDGAATVYCDDGFKNILGEEIEVFEYTYPKTSVIPYYVSETEALNAIMEDKTDIAITTTELTKDQIKYVKAKLKKIVRQKCIAVDAVAFITNKDNPVDELSLDEVRDIMNGKITRWHQIAGKDTTRIKLIFDNAGSSTVSFLRRQIPRWKRGNLQTYLLSGRQEQRTGVRLYKERPQRHRSDFGFVAGRLARERKESSPRQARYVI